MKILAFVDRKYPSDHSFLEGVMERRLTRLGHEILWVMQSATRTVEIEEKKWEYSKCLVLPNPEKLGMVAFFNNYIQALRSLRKVKKRLIAFSPDIVFVRNEPIYLTFALKLAGSLKLPTLFQLSHLKEEDAIERLSNTRGKAKVIYWLKGNIGRVLRNSNITRCDHVLPISDMMKEYLTTIIGVPAGKMTSVPLGVEPTVLVEGNKERVAKKYLLYVGTMAKARRLDVLINAFEIVSSSHPDFMLIMLGGGGEPKGRDELIKYVVGKKNLKERIIFISQVPRSEVPYYIKNATLAFSAIPEEGVMRMLSPTKLMEYMQWGCPVIATEGIPEQEKIIRESGGGLLVNFDERAIAEATQYMLDNPELARSMGEKAKQYIMTKRNYDKMVYEVEQIFKNVIDLHHKYKNRSLDSIFTVK